MSKPEAPRERWVLTVEVPAGTPNPGRFVARLLKHLLRAWGVRCCAVGEPPAAAQDAAAGDEVTSGPSGGCGAAGGPLVQGEGPAHER